MSDIDSDGSPDLIIGAPDDDQGGLLAGAVYIYSQDPNAAGLALGQQLPDAVLTGDSDGAQLGSSLAPVEDGVWIGAPGTNNGAGGLQFLLWY